MTLLEAGTRVDYTITHLEMSSRPAYPRPSLAPGHPVALLAADKPPVWYFLNLYDAVGAEYEWTDQHHVPRDELTEYLHHDQMTLFTMIHAGWPAGFFMWDRREQGTADLAYFGLVPEAIGLGLGKWLLQTAIHMGWDYPGIGKMTVQTCNLDHPRALALYQRCGFQPVRQSTKSRILTLDRMMKD